MNNINIWNNLTIIELNKKLYKYFVFGKVVINKIKTFMNA